MLKERLFTPGPVEIPAQVLAAMDRSALHHRTDTFERTIREAADGVQKFLERSTPPVFLAASGTGGMEASLLNVCEPGDKVLVVNGGEFGARWKSIAERLELTVVELCCTWGHTITEKQLVDAVTANPSLKAFCIQQCETSTTVMHPLETIVPLVRKHCPDTLVIVDGISACGTVRLPVNASIDIYIIGSQKALMLPPGLAIVSLSERAWKFVEMTKRRTLYFDFLAERKALAASQSAWTPATHLILGLNAALQLIFEEGLDQVYARHAGLARAARSGVAAMGFTPAAPEHPSTSVTGFFAATSIDTERVREQLLNSHGVRIAGGQGQWKNKVLRLGHMGRMDIFDIIGALASIEMTLRKTGVDVAAGASAAAAMKAWESTP